MNVETREKIEALFERTMRNVAVLHINKKMKLFLNEIGTAKGLLYSLQAIDYTPSGEYMDAFVQYVGIEKEMLMKEKRSLIPNAPF